MGLSGVGKGTVLEQAMNLADKQYKLINYGDRMLEIAKDDGLVESRDEIKSLDPETNKRVQKEAAESILEDAEEDDIIVETHAAIQTPYGYIPGLPEWSVKAMEPEKIIVIDASAEAIYERTREDSSRDREHDTVEKIDEYRQVAREMASAGSVMTGAYLTVIENPDGQAHQAAQDLVETLRA